MKERTEELKYTDSNCYDKYYDTVQPGVAVVSSGLITTASWVVDMPDGSQRMLTCAHQFGTACNTDIVGESIDQGGQKFGEVEMVAPEQDWLMIDHRNDGRSIDYQPYGVGGYTVGQLSKDMCADHQSQGAELVKSGYKTCETRGTIEEIFKGSYGCKTTVDTGIDVLSCDIENGQGDSGSPLMHDFFAGALYTAFGGILHGQVDHARFMSGYGIYNKYGGDNEFAKFT